MYFPTTGNKVVPWSSSDGGLDSINDELEENFRVKNLLCQFFVGQDDVNSFSAAPSVTNMISIHKEFLNVVMLAIQSLDHLHSQFLKGNRVRQHFM